MSKFIYSRTCQQPSRRMKEYVEACIDHNDVPISGRFWDDKYGNVEYSCVGNPTKLEDCDLWRAKFEVTYDDWPYITGKDEIRLVRMIEYSVSYQLDMADIESTSDTSLAGDREDEYGDDLSENGNHYNHMTTEDDVIGTDDED